MKKDPEVIKDKKDTKEVKEKKPREKKVVPYEGSRWASLILLLVIVVVSFFLYLTGQH